jgi:hypothetical protein
MHAKVRSENLKRRVPSKDLGLDGSIILQLILEKKEERM